MHGFCVQPLPPCGGGRVGGVVAASIMRRERVLMVLRDSGCAARAPPTLPPRKGGGAMCACLPRKRRRRKPKIPEPRTLWRRNAAPLDGATLGDQLLMKARRSAFTSSLSVVHMPCGAPL